MIAVLGAMAVTLLSHSYNFGAILQHESFVGGFGRVSFDLTDAPRKSAMRTCARSSTNPGRGQRGRDRDPESAHLRA